MTDTNGMELERITDPALRDVLDDLIRREPIFHRLEFGTKRHDFERMMDDAFWETGASGKRYGRADVLDVLEERHAHPHDDSWETSDFHCSGIAPDNYLLTYTLVQRERMTRRMTIWRRAGDGWKIVYHQGTLVEAD